MDPRPDGLITRRNRWLVVKRQKKLEAGQILKKLLKQESGFDRIVAGELLHQATCKPRVFARLTGTDKPGAKKISEIVSHTLFLFVQKRVHAGSFGVGA